jgi:hypothetical protein
MFPSDCPDTPVVLYNKTSISGTSCELVFFRFNAGCATFQTPESFMTDSYFLAALATASSPATKSAALLNSMISQATGAFLSIIMV